MRFHEFAKGTGDDGDSGNILQVELASWLVELPKPIGVFAANDAMARDAVLPAPFAGMREVMRYFASHPLQGCN